MDNIVRILHVDDEKILLKLIKSYLEYVSTKIEVISVTEPFEALQILNKQQYDAIISDYQMPGLNGIELLNFIREKGITTPFILLTAEEQFSQSVFAEHYYVKKSEEFLELCNTLIKAIESAIGRVVEKKYFAR